MIDNYLYHLSYGLFVLTVKCGTVDNGCIINTAIQIANSPGKICISVNKSNHTADMLDYVEDFTLSTVSEDAPFSLFRHFGFQSGRDVEKFKDYDNCKRVSNGTYAVTGGTNSYICAHIEQRIDVGSHKLIIAKITDGEVLSQTPSATYSYYQEHIKPQKKVTPDGKTVWRCRICGYEYDGNEIPDDFICPICKHPKSDFEKVN